MVTIHELSIYERNLAVEKGKEARKQREEQEALDDAYYDAKRMNDRYLEEKAKKQLEAEKRHSRSRVHQNFYRMKNDKSLARENKVQESKSRSYQDEYEIEVKGYSSRSREKSEWTAEDVKKALPAYARQKFQDEYNSTPYGLEMQLYRKYVEKYGL